MKLPFLRPFLQRPWSGLDVGKRNLKGISLLRKAGKVTLDSYFFQDLAEAHPAFPIIPDLPDTLSGLTDVAKMKGRRIATCLDDSEVDTFDLSLPKMPKADLSAAILNEVEQRLSYPIEQSVHSFVTLAEASEGSDAILKVYCSKLDHVSSRVNLMDSAGLEVAALEVAMLSNTAMLDFNGYLDETSTTLIIDLGESKTSMGLMLGKKLVMMNSLPISIGTINSRLMQKLGITYQESEVIKIRCSAKHVDEEPETLHVVDDVYLKLFDDLQKSAEFFRFSIKKPAIDRIFALGGGSQLSAVTAAIEQTCRAEVVVANPFRNIEIYSQQRPSDAKIAEIAPYMSTAVGLALRGIDGN